MDTVVATEADAPRRRGTKFKLTYRKICELSVAKGPIEGKQGSAVIAPAPNRGREARPGAGRQPGAPTGVGFYVGTTWTAYKLQVAKMIRGQGMSVMQVRRDQHLVERAVRRWLAQYDAEQAPAWSGHPLTSEHNTSTPVSAAMPTTAKRLQASTMAKQAALPDDEHVDESRNRDRNRDGAE